MAGNELVRWDYDKSVAWVRPRISNLKKRWKEVEPELRRARDELTAIERKRSTTGKYLPMERTWAQYCEDIGGQSLWR